MATSDILFSFFFFFTFLLPQIADSKCGGSKCHESGPLILFPFRLRYRQPLNCGYSIHFDLSCNSKQQNTILTLPSSGDFEVEGIRYSDQTMWINDLNWCMHKRFLDKDFSLVGTPFHFWHSLENYTYFKCPSKVVAIGSFAPISCLGDYNYNVIAVPSSWSTTEKPPPQSLCRAISTALLPASFGWGEFAVKLTWGVPDCRSCEATGRVCRPTVTSSHIECSTDGIPISAKTGIAIGVLIPAGLLCIVGYALYVAGRRDDGRVQETNRRGQLQELIEANGQPQVVTAGLDAQTIESYLKTQLGESLELPDPNDKTCSICLGEYQSKEMLRTIPECNHYFHVGCIDEWLRKNPTCPLCRNLPRTPEVSLVRPHDDHSMC
ncbi:RING-H2 finger protein ATL20-like isoform X1 [Rosa rugosa]|uniref:RING-H2 finger protein ATL20-like isoform X1 n=2 Tax=Rosa rugosa TaxID=74645 RepID=UPI002B403089|nr:RING-H2 finger protein ATL20-like isoform X1 [Rosa rugosa]